MAEWLRLFYRREILVARTVRGFQLEAVAEFDRQVVRPLLQEIGARLGSITATGRDLVQDVAPALQSLRAEIERTVRYGSLAVQRKVEASLAELERDEVAWNAAAIQRVSPATAPAAKAVEAVASAVAKPALWLGDSTEKWFDKMLVEPTAANTRAWVTTGLQRGLPDDAIVRGLVGTKNEVGILTDRPRAAVKALVRTAATDRVSNARMDSFKALGVKNWRFVATLDQRTTIQCAAQDGKVFPIGEGPIPPLHVNCRSATAPVIGDPDAAPVGTRAALGGPVQADTTFEEWLTDLPVSEQEMVLGKTKTAAWRAGKLTLAQMLGQDLQPLTLAELRNLGRL